MTSDKSGGRILDGLVNEPIKMSIIALNSLLSNDGSGTHMRIVEPAVLSTCMKKNGLSLVGEN